MKNETKTNDPWYAEFAKRQSEAFALADVMMSQAYALGELTKDQQTCIQIGYASAYENAFEEKSHLEKIISKLKEMHNFGSVYVLEECRGDEDCDHCQYLCLIDELKQLETAQ